jgi:small GTP-binding protein
MHLPTTAATGHHRVPTKPILPISKSLQAYRRAAIGLLVVAAVAACVINRHAITIAAPIAVALILAEIVATVLERPTAAAPPDPRQSIAEILQRARAEAATVDRTISEMQATESRDALRSTLNSLQAGQASGELRVAVFGTVSSGKTSVINALMGRQVAATGPTHGTTTAGTLHTTEWTGLGGAIFLTDTPGISEASAAGMLREREARDLAERSDLLLFVVDHDLVRSEFDALARLAQIGKPLMVIFNKADLYPPADRAAIMAAMRDRLAHLVDPADILAVSADPRPVQIRTHSADGSSKIEYKSPQPEIEPLRSRLLARLKDEGEQFRARNFLLQTRRLADAADASLADDRAQRAQDAIDRATWTAAAAVLSNPLPALDLLASPAVQYQLARELAQIYQVTLPDAAARHLVSLVAQNMLKLGLVEAATSLVSGLFKRTPLTFAAAGSVQALAVGYLTQIAGRGFRDYFANGQSFGAGGVQAALIRQFDELTRADFLIRFASQAVWRLFDHARSKFQSSFGIHESLSASTQNGHRST